MSTQMVSPSPRPGANGASLSKAETRRKRRSPAPFCVRQLPPAAVVDAMKHSAAKSVKAATAAFGYLQMEALYKRYLIDAALAEAKNVKKHAAAKLGISRNALNSYLKRSKELA